MRGEVVRAAILLGPIEVSALRNSEVSAFQGVWLYVSLWRYIPDRAKCPDYRGCPHFRGVHKVGFHCTWKYLLVNKAKTLICQLLVLPGSNIFNSFCQ